MRYMDDGRAFLSPIKAGWRWKTGRLRFKKAWREEDKDKTGLEITRAALEVSMQEVLTFLRFTTEVGEGEGGWLPTLDIKIRIERGSNKISFKYFEKPSTTNVMVQKKSALDENSKSQILANELMRRLGNTDQRQEDSVKGEVVDQFSVKVLTSGYSLLQTRRIALTGIRGWERKVERAQKEGRRLYRTAEDSLPGRIKKKTIGRTSWYKKKRRGENSKESKQKSKRQKSKDQDQAQGRKKEEGKNDDKEEDDLETAAVLFVENTKGGALAKEIREILERLKVILRYRIKVVERSGTPLKLMFPLSKVGEGGACGREDCTTCTQESRGETLPPCRKRSILYENICLLCNPDAGGEEKKKLTPPTFPPSIYVGESSRSLYERGKEHWRSYRAGLEDSHIRKHHILHHEGRGEPKFHLRPVMFHRSSLGRQIAEAVRIERWGEDLILNSKAEFNRSRITRLTLGEEKPEKKEEARIQEEDQVEDNASKEWEKERIMTRRIQEIRNNINLER